MTDTPETDALPMTDDPLDFIEMIEHARKLERERDEARDLAVRFRSMYYTQLGIDLSASWLPWEERCEINVNKSSSKTNLSHKDS